MNLYDYIEEIPDFPVKGILFKDISPLLSNNEAVSKVKKEFLKTNRVGDHIWYVSSMKKFKKDYPKWKQSYSTKKIIIELIDQFSF